MDHLFSIVAGDGDGAGTLGELKHEAAFFFTQKLDIADVDHISAVASEQAFVKFRIVERLH